MQPSTTHLLPPPCALQRPPCFAVFEQSCAEHFVPPPWEMQSPLPPRWPLWHPGMMHSFLLRGFMKLLLPSIANRCWGSTVQLLFDWMLGSNLRFLISGFCMVLSQDPSENSIKDPSQDPSESSIKDPVKNSVGKVVITVSLWSSIELPLSSGETSPKDSARDSAKSKDSALDSAVDLLLT